MNFSLPTLGPWLRGHVFSLLTIACGAVTLYSFSLWNIDGPDLGLLLGMVVGAIGLINFGVVALVRERRTLGVKIIGGIGIAAGVAMLAIIACIVLVVILFLGLLAHNASSWH